MKKLIAETDFDDLEKLSRKWKKPAEDQSNRTMTDSESIMIVPNKENISVNLPAETTNFKKKQEDLIDLDYKKVLKQEKRTHTPHVIDEDTEHFKVRLEHLLNVFKTDAISEFMGMKRSMLDDQKEQVRADTEKYLKMYEQKHDQLVQTRQNLVQKTRQCQIKTARIQAMADMLAKEKQKTRSVRYLATPFATLIRYKEYKQVKKFKQNQAERANRKRLLAKGIKGWFGIFRQEMKQKDAEMQQKQLDMETAEISNKYQKEILMLKERLAQATTKVEQYEKNKSQLQDNLKKAFMKGICAMNFEAMNALQGKPGQQLLEAEDFQPSHMEDVMSQTMTNPSVMPNVSSMSFGKREEFGNKSVIVLGQQKIQSKEHRWKEAPILGIDSEDMDLQPLPTVPECAADEGKVIRVINGKSTSATPSKPLIKQLPKKTSVTGSRTPDTMIVTKKK